MASALTVLQQWAGGDEDKQRLLKTKMELAVRWLNDGQLRFVNRSMCLRAEWLPTITSSGNIDLPDDFLMEFPDRVKRQAANTADLFLTKYDYQVANNRYWAGLFGYSIFNGKFYVWTPSACTPSVPYCRKPEVILSKDIATAELEIPTEVHTEIIVFLEARHGRYKKELTILQEQQVLDLFDEKARHFGVINKLRVDKSPQTRGGFF